VVPLGAPELGGDGLLAAWTAFAAWCAAGAAERAASLADAGRRVTDLAAAADALAAALDAELARHGLTAGDDLAGTALAAATGAHAEARAARDRIREQLARAGALVDERAARDHEEHVARLLAQLLRSDRFPRWLATAALEGLVIDASETLLRLSDGQFDLDHDEKGDLVVIDHADADSRRSVRTLSGGETFQASLALALALSAQMSQLSASAGAGLDSIFLDEGFGTLDPDTLEVVAGTLETLAHGERMVGVITHVPALADRVPVRFAVRRDARTSTVERQDA
jgi:exonuclease SbcC